MAHSSGPFYSPEIVPSVVYKGFLPQVLYSVDRVSNVDPISGVTLEKLPCSLNNIQKLLEKIILRRETIALEKSIQYGHSMTIEEARNSSAGTPEFAT
uniref:Uncharacterized protein n=1 Tax=Angiostrongylus cantonensis TaxID=6313 RepID=A0A0K0DKQ8_ANGCA